MKIRFYVNDQDVSEWISEVSSHIAFEENKLIGNTPSMELSMKVDNSDGKFDSLLDFPFLMKDENLTLLGTFYVYEKPEKMTKELNLELYDSLIMANENYGSSLEYPTSVENIIDEISECLEIDIDHSLIPSSLLNKEVNFYDSSETMRTHLGWIAEAGGCNLFAQSDTSYKFVPLSKTVKYVLDSEDVEQFEKADEYSISGVKIDNGLTPILSGNESKNVYMLDEMNPYIDKQSDVDLIYESLNNLSFYSCRNFKIAAIDTLRCGELIDNDDLFDFMAMSIDTSYLNATYDIQEISGEINGDHTSKTNTSSTGNKIRRIISTLDQNNASLNVLAQNVEENNGKIGELELNSEQFRTEMRKIEVMADQSIAVSDVNVQYGVSNNEDTSPSEWESSLPEEIEDGCYLWIRQVISYSNGLVLYSNERVLSIQNNADSKGIEAVTLYYFVSDSDSEVPLSGWEDEKPIWTFDQFLWQKEVVSYTDESSLESTPICITLKTKLEDVDTSINQMVLKIASSIQQVAEGLEINKTKVDSLGQEVQEWARFDGSKLELGASNSTFKAVLSNSELAFYQGSNKVAWLSNNELHVLTAVITSAIGVGSYRFTDEGSLGFSLLLKGSE
ncbi:hypothetical protein [Traorella massiliensis]|uniref:hypothetical protein n=1 Tax=Traorella massiliensis TaxID=1903263 RepID=UPI0008F918E5|nr:hypothetical protein [Traorella massiliensis]